MALLKCKRKSTTWNTKIDWENVVRIHHKARTRVCHFRGLRYLWPAFIYMKRNIYIMHFFFKFKTFFFEFFEFWVLMTRYIKKKNYNWHIDTNMMLHELIPQIFNNINGNLISDRSHEYRLWKCEIFVPNVKWQFNSEITSVTFFLSYDILPMNITICYNENYQTLVFITKHISN